MNYTRQRIITKHQIFIAVNYTAVSLTTANPTAQDAEQGVILI